MQISWRKRGPGRGKLKVLEVQEGQCDGEEGVNKGPRS